ncbi:thiopeptide maturation pyridine synthase [Nonomuraea diastatica]|uniref:thiopeptide maturation pyridine synthase n=1 Tax=Nonomuraea diastatica TaxID=1848329 RepID=UPI00140D8CCB|nr:thiopeptide maturation pyridine synthase [Nonomuraea diastatica]
MEWHSIHVYYHADKDALVLGGVRPLFATLSAHVAGAAYIPHWKRGPHLRLHLRCGTPVLDGVVWPAVHEIIGGFLAEHPSKAALEPEQHLPMHRRLAELEHESEPLLPWHPDNSIRPEPYDRRIRVLGSEDAADLLADFYSDTTPLAFDMTEALREGGRRLAVAFDVMIATAHALSGAGIEAGFISFRSHAEAFLAAWPEAEGLRTAWEEHYHRNSAQLAARVRAIIATLDGEQKVVPFVDEWVAALSPFRRRGTSLIRDGRLSMVPPPYRGFDPMAELAQVSSFHKHLVDPAWQEIRSADWFNVYRLMLNYAYLHLTRLGVTPVERFLLCHLAANAVEECYGKSATELIADPGPNALLDPSDLPS